METADVVVVGLGAMGSATLYRLARAGVRAVGIDRFDPPHAMGSTHGGTRITRLAVAEGDAYVPLVRRSHAIWRELEAETGEELLRQTGLLMVGTGDGAPSHGKAGFLGETLAVARRQGVAHEVLDAGEVRRRFPQFRVGDGERGYFEPSAGVVFPERAVAVQLRLARALGAVVRPNEPVLDVRRDGDGVVVRTGSGAISAGRVVLTAGAWMPDLVGDAMPIEVHRQTLFWFEPDRPALYDPAVCPVFIWQYGATETDYLYGFPLMPGEPGVKLGSERYDRPTRPDLVDRVISDAEVDEVWDRHVGGRLLGLSRRLAKSATCLYSVTPDAGFVIERDGAVLSASCCSGHGFKHSPAVGEELAAAALEGARVLEPAFGVARFG